MYYRILVPFEFGGNRYEPSTIPVDIKDPACWIFAHHNGFAEPQKLRTVQDPPEPDPEPKNSAASSDPETDPAPKTLIETDHDSAASNAPEIEQSEALPVIEPPEVSVVIEPNAGMILLATLDLPEHVREILDQAGLETVGDAMRHPDLTDIKNIGRATRLDIINSCTKAANNVL